MIEVMSASRIRTQCTDIVAAGARGGIESHLGSYRELVESGDLAAIGTIMASTFVCRIWYGCTSLGLVEGEANVPKFQEFTPAPRDLTALLSAAITRGPEIASKRFRRRLIAQTSDFIDATVHRDQKRIQAVYGQLLPDESEGFLLFLWLTAVAVQRAVDSFVQSNRP